MPPHDWPHQSAAGRNGEKNELTVNFFKKLINVIAAQYKLALTSPRLALDWSCRESSVCNSIPWWPGLLIHTQNMVLPSGRSVLRTSHCTSGGKKTLVYGTESSDDVQLKQTAVKVVLTYSCAISVVGTAFVSPLQNLLIV